MNFISPPANPRAKKPWYEGLRCWFCGHALTRSQDRRQADVSLWPSIATQDHLLPRCRGGSDTQDNIVPACFRCNRAKGEMTLEEYRESMGGGQILR